MSLWHRLIEELNKWSDAGHTATFWWRDDDAVAVTPHLERLLRHAASVPLCLAVIPELATQELADRLKDAPSVVVLQHGWNHSNHAVNYKSEYPPSRPDDQVERELAAGRRLMLERCGAQFVPVFVPPWHGFDERFLPLLPANGLTHISRVGPRVSRFATHNLIQVNIHVAPIRWTVPRTFGAEDNYLSRIIDHLAGRRIGQYDASEPTGLLTHHLDQNERSFKFISELFSVTLQHPAGKWLDGRAIFCSSDDPSAKYAVHTS